ncbi:MAG: exodeoxyribonuclease VII small subunit [Lautropia sp.]|nr:exodeoxyribonuclease VII small subunit [Lautropia sp.]
MSRSAPAEKTKPLPDNFEDAMRELESLIEQMEGGQLPLEASLLAYRRGVELVRHCRDRLTEVAQQVEVLDAGLLVPYAENGSGTGTDGVSKAAPEGGFDEASKEGFDEEE